jgi:putative ABC transport system substrate-binding protein
MNCCPPLPAWRFWSTRRFLPMPSQFREARRRRPKRWDLSSILCMRATIVISDAVFERLIQLRVGALVIGPDNVFTSHSGELAKLTVRHEMPAIYEFREFAAAGGLMSYGSSEPEYYRLVGTYAGRVLKGDKPADLPVQQSTKVELFLNLKTAKALGITVPLPLSGRADEVFE